MLDEGTVTCKSQFILLMDLSVVVQRIALVTSNVNVISSFHDAWHHIISKIEIIGSLI